MKQEFQDKQSLEDLKSVGVIIVDHGSRRDESNQMFELFVHTFKEHSQYSIVQPAHMELSEPTIETAFDACVKQGATSIIVCPYFLLPGKHWDEDIPNLSREAAKKHPDVKFLVSAPIGLHPMMQDVVSSRIDRCLKRVQGKAAECESCEGSDRCKLEGADD